MKANLFILFLLALHSSCNKDPIETYYIRALVDSKDWEADEFTAELYKGDLTIQASSADYDISMKIEHIGTVYEKLHGGIVYVDNHDLKFKLVASAVTTHELDSIKDEVKASFRFVMERVKDPSFYPQVHVELGEMYIPFTFKPHLPDQIYCEVPFIYDESVNERLGPWRLISITDLSDHILSPPCTYKAKLQLTEEDSWVQEHLPGFVGEVLYDSNYNLMSAGYKMLNDSTMETSAMIFQTFVYGGAIVSSYEVSVFNALLKDTLDLHYDHNLFSMENSKGQILRFYYDPE